MPFDKQGFLSPDSQTTLQDLARTSGGAALEFLENIALVAWQRQYQLAAEPNDHPGQLAVALYAKIVSTAQAATIVLKVGLTQSAEALSRVALEALFQLAALTNDASVYGNLEANYWRERERRINGAKSSPDRALREAFDDPETDRVLQRCKDELANLPSVLPVEQLAAKAGLQTIYRVLYAPLCDAVHTSLPDLERFMKPGPRGVLVMQNEPDFDGISWAAVDLSRILISAMDVARPPEASGEDLALAAYDKQLGELEERMSA